jgi:hypothetical protein
MANVGCKNCGKTVSSDTAVCAPLPPIGIDCREWPNHYVRQMQAGNDGGHVRPTYVVGASVYRCSGAIISGTQRR